jgi:isopentenyl-diphosphate Delta-isomerase
MHEEVILVDENDRPVGTMEKMEAHARGALHRAFSVFIFDSAGRLLLQKRAAEKYHSGGLWTNTCCGHPREGEETGAAARRRLQEEMGIACELTEAYSFIYRTEFGNGLFEHEFDHVFLGTRDGNPVPHPEEAEDWKWADVSELESHMRANPDAYSFWLKASLADVLKKR